VRTARLVLALLASVPSFASDAVILTTRDHATIHADLYGTGERAVVLAHGGRYDKKSWQPQALALANAGYRVLALDFRGFGESKGPGDKDPLSAPLQFDLLAAVQHLRSTGATSVAIVGASLGAIAIGPTIADAKPGEIDRIVLLGAAANSAPSRLTMAKLYIVTSDDQSGSGLRRPKIRAQYDAAPSPKEWLEFEGGAHAQALFETEHGEAVLDAILRFLKTEPRVSHVVDHLIVGIGDLDRGMALFEQLSGVRPVYGGAHPGRGTHNALVALGETTYLEIVAPVDPEKPPSDFESLRGVQVLLPIGWAVNSSNLARSSQALERAGLRLSESRAGGRERPDGSMLRWKVAALVEPEVALAPFLIEWADGSAHPAATSPRGCRIQAVMFESPEPAPLRRVIEALDLDALVEPGAAPRIGFELHCPLGAIRIESP
jgi:esterase/lipase